MTAQTYIAFHPVNFLLVNPNLQFGFNIKNFNNLEQRRYLDISLTYPYGKNYALNGMYTTSFKINRLEAIQAVFSYRVLRKKNKFWAPTFEVQIEDGEYQFY
ncbi:MAG: hypothetical protein R2852_08725, partial [Bacteroidia bacterium]